MHLSMRGIQSLRHGRWLAGYLRQGGIEAGPVRGCISPNSHLRPHEIWIIKGSGTDEDQVRPGFGLAEQGRSAGGQNPRCMRLPLSAMLSCQLTLPCTENESERKHTLTMPFPPLRYWQRRHQHTLAARGASDTENLTALHRHPPDVVMGHPFHDSFRLALGRLASQGTVSTEYSPAGGTIPP